MVVTGVPGARVFPGKISSLFNNSTYIYSIKSTTAIKIDFIFLMLARPFISLIQM